MKWLNSPKMSRKGDEKIQEIFNDPETSKCRGGNVVRVRVSVSTPTPPSSSRHPSHPSAQAHPRYRHKASLGDKLGEFNVLKHLKHPEQPHLVASKEPATGNVASAIFYLRFYVKSAGHVFQGNAGGISLPGGGALYGDGSSNLLGHAEFGGVSIVVGVGGGSGSWQKE